MDMCPVETGHGANDSNGNGNGNTIYGIIPKDKRASMILSKKCIPVAEFTNDEGIQERNDYLKGVLLEFRKKLLHHAQYHIGYPVNLAFEFGCLDELPNFILNNVGDPFMRFNHELDSRRFEIGVLDWFARVCDLDTDDYWGYVTTGGTEGNMHGIFVGRELLPDSILYASEESHYSIFKIARLYKMQVEKVNTLSSGEIDYRDLYQKLLKNKDRPAVMIVNIGTTFKGAVDDVDLVIQTLEEAGFGPHQFYIHCDGALLGLMLPFLKRAPRVSFKKPIGSFSVSGHKFLGIPIPCGIQITRMKHIKTVAKEVEYIASKDATILGSRSGHAPVYLWYTLNLKGHKGLQDEAETCLANARYLRDRLNCAGIRCMLNDVSCTVVFEKPEAEEFVCRWQLSCMGDMVHVVVMPNVTLHRIDCFLEELLHIFAKTKHSSPPSAPTSAAANGKNLSAAANGNNLSHVSLDQELNVGLSHLSIDHGVTVGPIDHAVTVGL